MFQINLNEAVNFAVPDWIDEGRNCVKRYQEHQKLPVFSHDELLITITQHSQTIKTAVWYEVKAVCFFSSFADAPVCAGYCPAFAK